MTSDFYNIFTAWEGREGMVERRLSELKMRFILLMLTMLWANSADNKLMIFFLFFLENRI